MAELLREGKPSLSGASPHGGVLGRYFLYEESRDPAEEPSSAIAGARFQRQPLPWRSRAIHTKIRKNPNYFCSITGGECGSEKSNLFVLEQQEPPVILSQTSKPKSQPAVTPGPLLPIHRFNFGSAALPLTDGWNLCLHQLIPACANSSLPAPAKASGSSGCISHGCQGLERAARGL